MADDVGDALIWWRVASRELDLVIGIELDDEVMAPLPIPLDVERFRRALRAERLSRQQYVALLHHHREPVPAELLWDSPYVEPALPLRGDAGAGVQGG